MSLLSLLSLSSLKLPLFLSIHFVFYNVLTTFVLLDNDLFVVSIFT